MAHARRAVASGLLVAGIVVTATRRDAYAPPDRPMHEVAALRRIDRQLEPNAALIARADTLVVQRLLRTHGDRVFVPVGLDQLHMLIVTHGVKPLTVDATQEGWLRSSLSPAEDADAIARRVSALLDEGRPVYFLGVRGYAARGMADLFAKLSSGFRLEPVAEAGSGTLFRVLRRPARRFPDATSPASPRP